MSEISPSYRGLDSFHHERGEDAPVVRGRQIKHVKACRVCSLVRNLEAQGYTFDEAVDVESNVYRLIYSMWDASEIARWLNRVHDYEISHDSVNRHINNHIPDPAVAFMERVRSYGSSHMSKQFIKKMTDTMRLTAEQFRQDILTGAVEIKPSDFIKIFEVLREWDELSGNREETILSAVITAMDEIIEDEDLKKKVKGKIIQELERVDNEQEE